MKLFGKELKFNNNKVYHAGDKPTASEIGAAASSHTHNYAGSSSAGGAATSALACTGNAATATKLAKAVTINGVAFDGSSNITIDALSTGGNSSTATKLQTARTLTVGNTGKSFDGSANVSWSLAEIGALPLSGGTLTAPVNNSYSTNTYLAGNQGKTLINSTCSAGAYTMLYKYPSTNGYYTIGGYQGNFLLQYTAKSTVDAGTNSVTKSVTLLSEAGNSNFPGSVTATAFSGPLSGNASTATTLQTARTINGTNFDGSTAITTASWGTARTLTIGNSGKSVNGSGNVSWSLAEIGAFGKQGEVTASTDWNALRTPGVYKVQMSAWGATSLGGPNNLIPGLYSFGMLFVYQSNVASETRTVQTYYPHRNDNNHPILTRMYNNTAWNSWSKIGRGLTYSDVGAAASSHTHNYAGSSSAGGAATSAIKLATARTINGTSFDGSANITTANWGTARTLTVGNTGKSVNGSGNVSWSLNEIGALPGTTISATIPATVQWYRIAQTTSASQKVALGTFSISAISTATDRHMQCVLHAGIMQGKVPKLSQSFYSQHTYPSFSKARIVYSSSNVCYLEIYVGYAVEQTINVQLYGSTGWQLVTPNTVGSIPSGYSSSETTLNSATFIGSLSGTVYGNASTASTLYTSRTINGTSFNGSSNITTANWGTARNITIGKTTKSVNGSANVTWTLDEIGISGGGGDNFVTVEGTFTYSTISATLPDGWSVNESTMIGAYIVDEVMNTPLTIGTDIATAPMPPGTPTNIVCIYCPTGVTKDKKVRVTYAKLGTIVQGV